MSSFWRPKGAEEVMKDVIWKGPGTNHGGLLVTSQTVFTKRLVQAALRGETIDSLFYRKMATRAKK